MTTNAGAADMAKSAFGFTRTKREGDDTEAVNRMFSPEFRNRLDATIAFGHLPRQVVAQVVDKFVMQLDAQLADRNISIELSMKRATGWSSTAMTKRWAQGRWRGSSSSISNSLWRMRCCSAA